MYRLYKQLQKDSDLLATLAKKYNLIYNSIDPSQSISSASQLSTTLKPSIKVTSSEPTRLKGPVLLSITALGAALVATAIAESDTTAGASLREYQRAIVSLGNSAVNATSQLADLIAEETWMLAAAIEETFSQSEEGSGDTLASVVEADSSAAVDYNTTATTALVQPIAEPIHVDDERPNFNLTETEAVHSTPTPSDDANAVKEPAKVLPMASQSIVPSLREHSSSPLTSSPETLPTSITESDYIALNEAAATVSMPKAEQMDAFVDADVSTTGDTVEVKDKGVSAEEAVEVGRSDVEPPVVHSISFQAPLTKAPVALERSVDPIDVSAVSSLLAPSHTDTAPVPEGVPVITLEQKPAKKAAPAKRTKTSKATLSTTETPSQTDTTFAGHTDITADALNINKNTATKSVTPKRAAKKTKKATSDDGQETTAASLESLTATTAVTSITSNTPAIDSVTTSVATTASVAVSDSSQTTTPTTAPTLALSPIDANTTAAAVKQTVKTKKKPALTLEKPIKPQAEASASTSASLKKTKETITLETNTDTPNNKSTSKRKTKAI